MRTLPNFTTLRTSKQAQVYEGQPHPSEPQNERPTSGAILNGGGAYKGHVNRCQPDAGLNKGRAHSQGLRFGQGSDGNEESGCGRSPASQDQKRHCNVLGVGRASASAGLLLQAGRGHLHRGRRIRTPSRAWVKTGLLRTGKTLPRGAVWVSYRDHRLLDNSRFLGSPRFPGRPCHRRRHGR